MQMNLDDLEIRLFLFGYTKKRITAVSDGHYLSVYSFPERKETMPYSITIHIPNYGDPWVNMHYPIGVDKLKSHWRISVNKAIEWIDKGMEESDDN